MFRPSIHGWPFRNAYTCTGPELGIGGPPPPDLGLAGGFCWAALDRYLRGVAIARDTMAPEPGDPLHLELLHRQVAAVAGVWVRVREWQGEPDGSWRDSLPIPVPLPGSDLASRTRAEWRGIRKRISAGRPVLLTLLPAADGYEQARAVKQVLTTGWSRQGSRAAFSIYDPDHPEDDERRLTFGLTGPLDARLTGGSRIRGFFPVPYDRDPPAVMRTESFDDRLVIGLNRTVRGRVSSAVGRKHLDLVARNDRGALIHFRRARGSHWDSRNVTEAEGFGASELHSDPVALHGSGALHAFARSYVGDLLHFRLGRSWSVTNCTDQKGAGPRFRLQGRPVPVSGPWRQLTVIGRDADGGLVHYHSAPFRGWKAEQVPGDAVASDPEAARSSDALHVVATAADGRLLHWARQEEWAITDPEAGDGPTVRFTGKPALVLRGDTVQVVGRDRNAQLAILTLIDGGEWQRVLLAEDLAGDPRATRGPAGLHIFAPTRSGGVAHVRETPTGWEWEDVVASRPGLAAAGTGAGEVACWGSPTELRVFVRRGPVLRALTWTPGSDWVADPITRRAGTTPVLVEGYEGRPHLTLADENGTVLHVETGAWTEARPTDDDAPAEVAPAAAGAAAAPIPTETVDDDVAAAESVEEPEPVDAEAGEPEPVDAEAGGPDTGRVHTEVLDFEAESLMEDLIRDPEPGDAIEPEEVEPVETEPEEIELEDELEDELETVIYVDAEEDAEPGEEEPGPEVLEPMPEEPEPEEVAEPEPEEEPEREPIPPAAEAEVERVAAEAEADTESRGEASPEKQPAEGEKPFRGEPEDDVPPGMPEDMEPMDLSLLDTWPPSHKRRRRSRRKRDPDEEKGKDEESS